jgi:hypothetical protein
MPKLKKITLLDRVNRLKIVCAWCGSIISEPDGAGPDKVSHGICEDCKAVYFPPKKGRG